MTETTAAAYVELCRLYGITDASLAARRSHVGLGKSELRTLARLRSWAHDAAGPIAKELTDHTFEYGPTGAFMAAHVAKRGMGIDELRAACQDAQVGHFRAIFEAAKP